MSDLENVDDREKDHAGQKSSDREGTVHKSVTIGIDDWLQMKRQNEQILEFLSNNPPRPSLETKGQKRKRAQIESDSSESEVDEQVEKILLGESDDPDTGSNSHNMADHADTANADNASGDGAVVDELDLLQQEYENDEETGKPISEKWAKILEAMSKGKMNDDKLKEKMRKRPDNVRVFTPRVNAEIWSMMAHTAKSSDLKSQKWQSNLISAAFALTEVVEKLVNTDKAAAKPVSDAMGLILKTVHDLSMERRAKILNAPQVNQKYKRLMSADIPITQNLFGDDLKGAFAAIESTSKLGFNFTQTKSGKFQPMKAKNGKFTKDKRSWNNRQGKEGRYKKPYKGQQRPKAETADAE